MFGVWKRSFKFGLLPERASLACWICSFMVSYSENKAINDVIGANSDKLCWKYATVRPNDSYIQYRECLYNLLGNLFAIDDSYFIHHIDYFVDATLREQPSHRFW